MKQELQKLITAALKTAFSLDIDPETVHLERPADASHGDWATNVAMTLAKELKMAPRAIAEGIVASLQAGEYKDIESIEVAGPGFINFKIADSYYQNALGEIDSDWGSHNLGSGKQVMIEFGQPNTHKAFHVGHLKSAISGLSIIKLYENLGYKVIKANFYGDVGMHVANCTWGALDKGYDEAELEKMDPHERMKIIDSFYVHGAQNFKNDSEIEAEIREINKEIYAWTQGDQQNIDSEVVKTYKQLRDWSLEHQADIFSSIGFEYDREYPESEISTEAVGIVENHRGDIFTDSQGAVIYDGESKGMTTWVFLTSEGLPTYEAKDLALAYKKFQEYDLDLSIITTSMEQIARFKVIIHCLELIDEKFKDKYVHLPFGWMLRDNKKTSSRMGESVKGMDILNEARNAAADLMSADKGYSEDEQKIIADRVGQGGLKFLILSHEFHKDINYDPENFITLEGFSGPYVMYAYARCNSILTEGSVVEKPNLSLLTTPEEINLIKHLLKFPEVTLAAGQNNTPHLVAYYAYELAGLFNQFYNDHPILKAEDNDVKQVRLRLTEATAQVLKKSLNLLGIETVGKM